MEHFCIVIIKTQGKYFLAKHKISSVSYLSSCNTSSLFFYKMFSWKNWMCMWEMDFEARKCLKSSYDQRTIRGSHWDVVGLHPWNLGFTYLLYKLEQEVSNLSFSVFCSVKSDKFCPVFLSQSLHRKKYKWNDAC